MLYEHVHLTFRGTYEAARELFPRITADLTRRGLVSGPPPTPIDYEEARLRLGYNVYEQAMIAQQLLNRFRKPPFTGQADIGSRLREWERRSEKAAELLSRPDANAALESLANRALAVSPGDWILERNAGAMLVARGEPGKALPLLERASQWIDDDVDTLIALGHAQKALGREADAEATYAKARLLEPDYPGLPEASKSSR
jgi:tetratricopeptide (TPR) repeat protein